jgi:hypothetical protein
MTTNAPFPDKNLNSNGEYYSSSLFKPLGVNKLASSEKTHLKLSFANLTFAAGRDTFS